MTIEAAVFTCSICGEGSQQICVFCTKDACANHLCERCKMCSDCCVCEVRLVPYTASSAIGRTLPEQQVAESQVPETTAPETSVPETFEPL